MGAPLNPSIPYCCDGQMCFRVAVNEIPMMLKDARLSDTCTSDRCSFSSIQFEMIFNLVLVKWFQIPRVVGIGTAF